MTAGLRVRPLAPADRAAWEPLARAYKAFYRTEVSDAECDAAWARLMRRDPVCGLAADLDGHLVGIAHYLFHASTWADRACYLQDLYVDEAARGRGAAAALIEAVGAHAREAGATRTWWLTHQDNVTARRLYDRVARHHGMIRYDLAEPPPMGLDVAR